MRREKAGIMKHIRRVKKQLSRKVAEYKKANQNKNVRLHSRQLYGSTSGAYGTVFLEFSFKKGSKFYGQGKYITHMFNDTKIIPGSSFVGDNGNN